MRDERFEKLMGILKESDVTIVNLETVIHTFKGYPECYNGQGTPMHSDPEIADELVWAGIDMVSFANNHTYDYGPAGILETIQYLSERNIRYTGAGIDETEAKSVATLSTSRNDIGLIGTATSYTKWGVATPSNNEVRGKPGVYGIRLYPNLSFLFELIFKRFAHLGQKQLERLFGKKVKLFGKTISIESLSGTRYSLDKHDQRELLQRIRSAKKNHNCVIFSFHSHQGRLQYPPKFLIQLAHDCIENGADIVFSHGTHMLRGIEIYKGRPIFYGLGNLCFHLDSIDRLPADAIEVMGFDHKTFTISDYHESMMKRYIKDKGYWESVVPVIEISVNGPDRIILYPIILDEKDTDQLRGTPRMASQERAFDIIHKMQKLSKPFNTKIELDTKPDNITGVIQIIR
jgi:poly-gamma-glutamate capsule biosynthesis protein CapA/YwtB (metallophosphatase superfamily)